MAGWPTVLSKSMLGRLLDGLPLARGVRGQPSLLADAGLLAGRLLQLAGDALCSGPGCSEASLNSSLQGKRVLACRSGRRLVPIQISHSMRLSPLCIIMQRNRPARHQGLLMPLSQAQDPAA